MRTRSRCSKRPLSTRRTPMPPSGSWSGSVASYDCSNRSRRPLMAATNHPKEVSMFSKSVKSVCMIAALGVLVAGAAWAAEPEAKAPAAKPAAKAAKPAKPVDEVAVFETSKGRMVAEFWEKDAPQTVANFKKLARQGFYNGTGFQDRKSTRLNSSHRTISYAVFCLKKK